MLAQLLPWDFSPTTLVTVVLAALLFAHGARRLEQPVRTGQWIAFYLGLTLIYAALQTHWDYYAEHMFFIHRLQHFALHDVGPFLLAFSAPGAVLAAGIPGKLRQWLVQHTRWLHPLRHLVFDPVTATLVFTGSLVLWVWPSIHFDVMISAWLYKFMNWSVVLGDLPFWLLVLDRRPCPPARIGPGMRILMLVFAMVPMMLTGAILGLTRHDLYPVYNLCGRTFALSAVTDQQIGGLIIWIPGSTLAVVAALIVISRLRNQPERVSRQPRSGLG
jgi:putative membrane protein